MKSFSKILRVAYTALTLPLLISAFSACNTSTPSTDTAPNTTSAVTAEPTRPADTQAPVVTEAPETETETEAETEEASLPSAELTSDTIIYCPTRRNRTLNKLAVSLATRIQEKTGIKPSVRYGDDEPAPAEAEIILGFAPSRPATEEAYAAIRTGCFGVYTADAHSVITAWTEDDLTAAADLFVNSCLTREGERWTVQPATVLPELTEPTSAALSAYRIVYAEDADETIKSVFIPKLQEQLLSLYNVHVTAVSDAEAPTDYELVIGNTNRTTDAVKPYLEGDTALGVNQRAIICDGGKYFILGDSTGSIALAVSRLLDTLETYFIGQGTVLHALAPASLPINGENYVSAPMVTEDTPERAEGTDLRIMSYNILNQDYVPDNPLPPERDEQFADILLFYKPDVVGIQEANRAWHDSFETLFDASGAYLPACKYHEGDSTAQTTFLYNPLTVTLIDEYVIHYSDGVNDIRIVSFAVFERNSDGMRFVMTNTHPAPHAGNYEKHVDEFIRIKTEELAKYEGLPVIMTGDFNTRESQAQYTQIQTSLNVTDARYDEGVKLVRNICTYTSLPSGEAIHGSVYESSTGNIDHIFINDKLDALLFNVVIDHNVTNISDHLPIYADLKLK